MAATKVIPGSALTLSIDETDNAGTPSYTVIGASTSCSVSVTVEAIDTTNKDGGGRKTFIGGASSWTMDCEALFTDGPLDETVNPNTLYQAMEDKNRINVKFSNDSGQTGAKHYDGYGYITSLSFSAGVGEFGSYSLSIQGDGELSDG